MQIRDKVLDPFFIKFEDHSYDIHKSVVPKKDGGVPYTKLVGSKPTLGDALKLIVDAKMKSNKDVVTLKEYITEWRKIKIEIATLVNDDIDTRITSVNKKIAELNTKVDLVIKAQELKFQL